MDDCEGGAWAKGANGYTGRKACTGLMERMRVDVGIES